MKSKGNERYRTEDTFEGSLNLTFASWIGLVAGDEGKLIITDTLLALWLAKFSEIHKHRRALIFFLSTFRCYQFDAGILARVDRRVRVL